MRAPSPALLILDFLVCNAIKQPKGAGEGTRIHAGNAFSRYRCRKLRQIQWKLMQIKLPAHATTGPQGRFIAPEGPSKRNLCRNSRPIRVFLRRLGGVLGQKT